MCTERQNQVWAKLASGLLNKQIAYDLGITEGTVKSHVAAIIEQCGTSSRVATALAYLANLPIAEREAFLAPYARGVLADA